MPYWVVNRYFYTSIKKLVSNKNSQMKYFFIFIFLSIKCLLFSQSVFLIPLNDTNYVIREINGYDLRRNLNDGKYIVYYDQSCGERDTIIVGTIEMKKRVGKWKYYHQDPIPCWGENNLMEIRYYNKGYIEKVRSFSPSDRELFFKPRTKKLKGRRIISRVYRDENEIITRIDSIRRDINYSNSFNAKGQIVETSEWNYKFDKVVEFHSNGEKAKKYKILTLKTEERVLDGEYYEWDENGKLIIYLRYKKGKLIFNNSKRY